MPTLKGGCAATCVSGALHSRGRTGAPAHPSTARHNRGASPCASRHPDTRPPRRRRRYNATFGPTTGAAASTHTCEGGGGAGLGGGGAAAALEGTAALVSAMSPQVAQGRLPCLATTSAHAAAKVCLSVQSLPPLTLVRPAPPAPTVRSYVSGVYIPGGNGVQPFKTTYNSSGGPTILWDSGAYGEL